MRFTKVRQRLQRMRAELKLQKAQRLLSGPTINALMMRHKSTGQLPENRLQATYILYWEATLKAMESTCPSSNDSGAHYEACRQALREAAAAHNAERVAWGLPTDTPEALP